MEERIKQLIAELNRASKAYYGGYNEILTDHEWNAKFDELEALEKKTGIVFPCSPTQNVSHEALIGAAEKHEFPALSLPKSKSVDDVIKWINNHAVDLSWKLDGMTLVVTWDNGKLSKIVTRGDGTVGYNITHLADAIANIPKVIPYKKHLVVRGEAVISYADFELLNAEYDYAYDNARNLVSGSLNAQTTIDKIIDRHIIWMPFTLVYVEEDIKSWRERMMFLTTNIGLKVVSFEYIGNVNDISDTISRWSDNVDNATYPVDGLVVVYDDTEYASHGKFTGHHDTRGGYAFKWADEEKETELINVEWSVSIHSINPVAVFEPVYLEGTTVKRASLCNISECSRLGIGGKGTKLIVYKANKIIPKVLKATESHGSFVIPDKCPICGHDTAIKSGDSGVKVLVCTNEDCSAKNISKMSRFVSRYGFDINGLSNQKLIDLVNKGLISNMMDILSLPSRRDAVVTALVNEDGWGDKSINNLLNAITDSLTIDSNKLLYALCIPMCGRDVAKRLTKQHSLSDILSLVLNDASNETMTLTNGIDGIGEVKTQAFIDWFKNTNNVEMFETIMQMCHVVDMNNDTNDVVSKVSGLTFVITGSLNHYNSRDDLKDWIESSGGKVVGSVSAKTNYLINNDITSTSSKNEKAKKLGVTIISEDVFLQMFGD